MVAIVGWGHTNFGKRPGETLESLIVAATAAALRHAGLAGGEIDEIFLGHFNAGFSAAGLYRRAGAAGGSGVALQAGHPRRERLRDRIGRDSPGIRAIESGAAKIVLVVGVEQMTGCSRRGDRPQPAARVLSARRTATAGAASPACSAASRPTILPALWRPVRRAGDDRGEESQERRRQSLCADAQGPRLRFLPDGKRTQPGRRGPAEAHRLFAGLGRRGGARAGRRRHARVHAARGGFPRIAHVQDFLPMVERNIVDFEGCAVAWAARWRPASALADLSFVETHDCFTIAELIEYEAMGLTPRGAGRPRHQGRLDPDRRQAADQPLRRPEGEGTSDRRHRRVHACDDRDATVRRGAGRDATEGCALGGIFNMGGAAVANYVSILETRALNGARRMDPGRADARVAATCPCSAAPED